VVARYRLAGRRWLARSLCTSVRLLLVGYFVKTRRRLTPTTTERELMAFLLAGDEPPLPVLRLQWERTSVAKRVHDPQWGLWVDFAVGGDAPTAIPGHFEVNDVLVEFENVVGGGYCILFVRQGRLAALELANWVGPWRPGAILRSITYCRTILPEDDSQDAEYIPLERRDWTAFRQQLAESRPPAPGAT